MNDELSNVFGLELITGNDPQAALQAAMERLPVEPGSVWVCSVAHDEGCPSTAHYDSIAACTCEIVQLLAEQIN